jgi:hypothetical protein
MDTASENTEVQTEQTAPVTDTENVTLTKSETTEPRLEHKDGKMYVEGVGRVYTRDDTSKIAANAKHEAVNGLLRELDVDSLDQVRDVISTLKSHNSEEGDNSLDVRALKQTVAKREATLEELTAQVGSLKQELLMKDHIGNLNTAMPGSWTPDQRTAVLDLMKARDMFAVEGDQFQLRNGGEYLTVDGEKPDYASAVDVVAQTLGLNTGKRGVDVVSVDATNNGADRTVKPLDEARLKTDAEYRTAYMNLRQFSNAPRSSVTHNMVSKQLDKMRKQRQG